MTNATKKAIRLSKLSDKMALKTNIAWRKWYYNTETNSYELNIKLAHALDDANSAAFQARQDAELAVSALRYQFEIDEYRTGYNALIS